MSDPKAEFIEMMVKHCGNRMIPNTWATLQLADGTIVHKQLSDENGNAIADAGNPSAQAGEESK